MLSAQCSVVCVHSMECKNCAALFALIVFVVGSYCGVYIVYALMCYSAVELAGLSFQQADIVLIPLLM